MRQGLITTSEKQTIEETIIESREGTMHLWMLAAEHCGLTVNDFTDGRLTQLNPEAYKASRRGMEMLGVEHSFQVDAHNIVISDPFTKRVRLSVYLTQEKTVGTPLRLAITVVEHTHGGYREGAGRKGDRTEGVSLRLSPDVADHIREKGAAWVNDLVRREMEQDQ